MSPFLDPICKDKKFDFHDNGNKKLWLLTPPKNTPTIQPIRRMDKERNIYFFMIQLRKVSWEKKWTRGWGGVWGADQTEKGLLLYCFTQFQKYSTYHNFFFIRVGGGGIWSGGQINRILQGNYVFFYISANLLKCTLYVLLIFPLEFSCLFSMW